MPRQSEPEVMDVGAEADAYAAADFAEVNQAFADRLVELAGPARAARAVDLGTGPGDIPIRVLRLRPGWRITAVDASGAMLAHARRAVGEAGLTDAVELVRADAKALPLRRAAFDVVFSNSILHHINETERFWAEVRRIARPGALVFLRDLARPPSEADARAVVDRRAGGEGELLQEEFYRSLLSAYTVAEVRAQLDRAGLGDLDVAMATDRHWDVTGRMP